VAAPNNLKTAINKRPILPYLEKSRANSVHVYVNDIYLIMSPIFCDPVTRRHAGLFVGKFALIERLFLTMSFIAAHPTAIPPAPFSEGHCPTPSLSESPDSISSWQSVDYDRSIIENIERAGTPFVKRVSSVRLPDDRSNKTLEQLPSLLNLDLSGQDETILNDVSNSKKIIVIVRFMDHVI
jgi:hypothetical protein